MGFPDGGNGVPAHPTSALPFGFWSVLQAVLAALGRGLEAEGSWAQWPCGGTWAWSLP